MKRYRWTVIQKQSQKPITTPGSDTFFFCISNEGGLTLGSKILDYKQSKMAFTNAILLSQGCNICMYFIPKRGREHANSAEQKNKAHAHTKKHEAARFSPGTYRNCRPPTEHPLLSHSDGRAQGNHFIVFFGNILQFQGRGTFVTVKVKLYLSRFFPPYYAAVFLAAFHIFVPLE